MRFGRFPLMCLLNIRLGAGGTMLSFAARSLDQLVSTCVHWTGLYGNIRKNIKELYSQALAQNRHCEGQIHSNMRAADMKKDAQVTGNVGLYWTCYHLSRMGWNIMPTARNARGVDIIAYNRDCSRMISIQVKTLSKKNPVPYPEELSFLENIQKGNMLFGGYDIVKYFGE